MSSRAAASVPKHTVISKALTMGSEYTEMQQEEARDAVYFLRQVLSLVLGLMWGILPVKGAFGFMSFFCLQYGLSLAYTNWFISVAPTMGADILKEGIQPCVGLFLLTWIMTYSILYGDFEANDLITPEQVATDSAPEM